MECAEKKKEELKNQVEVMLIEFSMKTRKAYNKEKTHSYYTNSKDFSCVIDIRYICFKLIEEDRIDEAEKFIGNLQQIQEKYGFVVIRNKSFQKYIKKNVKSLNKKNEIENDRENLIQKIK